MKKHLFRVLVLMMTITMLASCGSPSVSPSVSAAGSPSGSAEASPSAAVENRFNAPGEFPIIKETVPLTIAMPQNNNVIDYKTNKFTKLVEERVNVDLSFDILPASDTDAKQKLALMAASGSKMPDIINLTLLPLEVFQYGTQGTFIPLNDMWDNLSYHGKQVMAENNDTTTIPTLTMPDGNIYSIPFVSYTRTGAYNFLAWINKTWLDTLGLDVPTTTEEYYEALKAMKTRDPNGNGKADEIPLVGAGEFKHHGNPFTFLMNAFIYVQPMTYLSVDNGKIDVPFNKPEWLEGLKYINRLASEGLLDPVTFTQDEAQFKGLLDYESDAIVGSLTYVNFVIYNPESVRKKDMVSLPPLTGPKGANWTTVGFLAPEHKYYITKDCADPEAAFLLGDYMLSYEASMWTRFGEPNVDYKIVDSSLGLFSFISPNVKTVVEPILIWGSVQNSNWMDGNPKYRAYDDADVAWNGDPWNQSYMKAGAMQWYIGKGPEEVVPTLMYTAEEQDQLLDITTTLIAYVEETATRLITGNESFDYWDAYLRELDKIGLQTYLELSQNAYDRMFN